jgi:Rrf2 family protein
MKINTNIHYGLRAMTEIAQNSEPVLQKEIAERQDIPLNYLDSIIAALKNAGLIVNQSGKRSGYILAKKPGNISVYQVYRAFSPELCLVNCTSELYECQRAGVCKSTIFWCDLNSKMKEFMNNMTLEELITH